MKKCWNRNLSVNMWLHSKPNVTFSFMWGTKINEMYMKLCCRRFKTSDWIRNILDEMHPPVYLWKPVHHSEPVIILSGCVSQDLKNASEHGSFLSRYRLLISDWSSCRSKFVSSRENIHPRGSLQMGDAPTSNSVGTFKQESRWRKTRRCGGKREMLRFVTHCSFLVFGSWLSCGCRSRAALWTSLSGDSPPPSNPTRCRLRKDKDNWLWSHALRSFCSLR